MRDNTKIWRCRRCGNIFNAEDIVKIQHKFGSTIIKDNGCPTCHSTDIECISMQVNTKMSVDEPPLGPRAGRGENSKSELLFHEEQLGSWLSDENESDIWEE